MNNLIPPIHWHILMEHPVYASLSHITASQEILSIFLSNIYFLFSFVLHIQAVKSYPLVTKSYSSCRVNKDDGLGPNYCFNN